MIHKIKRKLISCYRRSIFGRVKKNPDSVRWGIIGLGYMAETFACAIDGNKNGIVAAAASRNIEKAKSFAKRHRNCKPYGSYEEMIVDSTLNLDIIYIATPVKCHFENIKLCLEHGKNVICEKPITFTSVDLEQLISIARNNNCFLMEGMWMKCLPTFQKGIEWINSGLIGKMDLIKVDFYKHEIIRKGYTIYNPDDGGGVINDFGVYAIAFLEAFTDGMPEKIIAQSRISPLGLDTDWQIMTSLGSCKCAINLSSDFSSLSKAAIIGSKGSIEWDSQFNRTNSIKRYDENGKLVESFKVNYMYEGFEYEVNEVQRCLNENLRTSSVASIYNSLNTLRILEHIKASANGLQK